MEPEEALGQRKGLVTIFLAWVTSYNKNEGAAGWDSSELNLKWLSDLLFYFIFQGNHWFSAGWGAVSVIRGQRNYPARSPLRTRTNDSPLTSSGPKLSYLDKEEHRFMLAVTCIVLGVEVSLVGGNLSFSDSGQTSWIGGWTLSNSILTIGVVAVGR